MASKPPAPKELSNAVKNLRFMSRKDDKIPEAIASLNSKKTLWRLPESTEGIQTSFHAGIRKTRPILFRRALGFKLDSDALSELLVRESLAASKKNVKANRSQTIGRYRSKDKASDNVGESGSVSSLDDHDIAQHFARDRKRRRRD